MGCWQHDCPPGYQRVQALACPRWHMLGPAVGSPSWVLAYGWVGRDVSRHKAGGELANNPLLDILQVPSN